MKTSFAPGSQVVTDYLEKAGLQDDLNAMGFNLVGYGCTTCIGNSGPLDAPISKAINENDLVASAVLSGNRNFEGRINPDVRANYLASPPLVVAYALAGSLNVNIAADPIDKSDAGEAVYLKDIWPSSTEIAEIVRTTITPELFKTRYADVFKGDEHWQGLTAADISVTYSWDRSPPTSSGRPSSTAWPRSQSRSRTSRARACWVSSPTRSPPTISAPQGLSRSHRPQGNI